MAFDRKRTINIEKKEDAQLLREMATNTDEMYVNTASFIFGHRSLSRTLTVDAFEDG